MAVTPLAFFQSPLHPPVGEFPTTRPKRGKGHASPWRVCHVPCCGTQMARRSSGLACRLQSGHRSRRRGRHGPCIFGRRLAGPPSRHFICTFHCFRFRLPMAAGDGPCPSALLLRSPCPRVNEDVTGVAVAGVAPKRRSSPALCTAAASVFPRPPSRLQSPAGAAFRGRTVGRFTPAPVRPAGAPSTPPGRAWRPLRGDRRDPPVEVTFVLPGPGRLRFAQTAGPRAFPRMAPRPTDAPLIRSNMNLSSGPAADTRFAVTALALRSFFFLPGPGVASLCSDVPGLGLSMRMSAALQSPGSRRSVAPYRLCAPLPLLILPHLRASLLRSISLYCYLMARSAVLCADTRRMRAAPLPRSLPLPHCLLPASPCRRETAKGAA